MRRLKGALRWLGWYWLVVASWLVFGGRWAFDKAESYDEFYRVRTVQVLDFLAFLDTFELPVVAEKIDQGKTFSNFYKGAIYHPERASCDLNTMDSAAFETLPRIGPKLAGRICRFREALGGYFRSEQLREVWGMQPDQFQAILPWFHVGDGVYRPICVDSASWSIMRRHPYIGVDGARIIERYRKQHRVSHIDDLKECIRVNDSLFRRWSPYLRVCLEDASEDHETQ